MRHGSAAASGGQVGIEVAESDQKWLLAELNDTEGWRYELSIAMPASNDTVPSALAHIPGSVQLTYTGKPMLTSRLGLPLGSVELTFVYRAETDGETKTEFFSAQQLFPMQRSVQTRADS